MEHVIRGTLVYLFLLVLFRISGKRTLAEVTTFDFILLLIISEAAQQALLGQDYSFTAAAIVITTLQAVLTSKSYRIAAKRTFRSSITCLIYYIGRPQTQ
jgi:uncharacterized membrane protein YcaP (DUF421 family)